MRASAASAARLRASAVSNSSCPGCHACSGEPPSEQAVAQPLPVVVGELGDYLDGFASSKYHRVINAQLHEYAAGAPARACVTARDLPHKGDHLHFAARAQRMLGLRYADARCG